jgi:uncharacterized membrane protein
MHGNRMIANLRHKLFIVSILLKGVFAVLEVLAGTVLLLSSPGHLTQFIHFMFHNRLVADPNDPFATYALHQLQDFDMTRHTFVSIYLMLHGLVKVGIVAGLYSERLWAFPIGLTALGIFIVYQMERFVTTHAPLLLVISILDAFIMVLAWREYQALKNRRA